MIRQFENLQFDNKSNLGIIQITGRRCTHSGPPVKLRFTALYTFPPLYTQKPAARRVFVFLLLFREKVGKKLFTVYRATLAALTLRLAGGRALHLNRRFGLRPCESKASPIPVPVFRSGDFLFSQDCYRFRAPVKGRGRRPGVTSVGGWVGKNVPPAERQSFRQPIRRESERQHRSLPRRSQSRASAQLALFYNRSGGQRPLRKMHLPPF